MFVQLIVLFLIVYNFNVIYCLEEDWNLYDNSFKHHNREEINISNVTTNLNFQFNFTVEKWVTLSTGSACYTGGITNNTKLVILFSTLSNNGTDIEILPKVYDLEEPISSIEFIQENKHVFVIAYSPKSNTLNWYSMENYLVNKIWTWPLEEPPITYFSTFKIKKNNFLIFSTRNKILVNYAIIYGFNINTLERWFYQSILLSEPTSSLCLTQFKAKFYLSVTQHTSSTLLIYKLGDDQKFSLQETLASPQIDQVVCFENGFKSFVAFNGFDSGIYEFTNEKLNKRDLINSNLEAIQFWLPIPIDIYRDETLLLCQRKLDHESHFSFDVDVVTYNGKNFEEHQDIACSLFLEQQNNLNCLTEFNKYKGVLGSSYIRVANYLALIVPRLNDSSIIFNFKVDLKSIEYPARKDLESLLERKKKIEVLIENNKKMALQMKNQAKLNSDSVAAPILQAKSTENKENFKNEVLDVINELDQIKEKVKALKLEGKYDTVTFNGPVIVESKLTTVNLTTKDDNIVEILNNIVRKDQLKLIKGHKTFSNLYAQDLSFEVVNNLSKNEFLIINNETEIRINGNITFENPLVNVTDFNVTDGLVNDVEIKNWVGVENLVNDSIAFDQLMVRNKFEADLLNNKKISLYPTINVLENIEKLVIPENVTVEILNGQNFEGFLKKLCIDKVECHVPKLKIKGTMSVHGNANIKKLNDLKFPSEYIDLEPKDNITITGKKEFKNITRGYKLLTNNTVNGVNLTNVVNLSGKENIFGTVTFGHLEVESDLNVLGDVKGEYIENFLPNIGLKETRNISANVEFLDLEVLGDLVIQNDQFNFSDIIFKDENSTTITGLKSFPQSFIVHKNLQINSGLINNISLNSIVTKDTDQMLNINTILGNVDFEYLNVQGFFDGVNITNLNEILINTFTNQSISSELIFEENIDVDDLIVNKLNNNNNEDVTDLLSKKKITKIIVEGNFEGNITNFNIEDFNENYLKFTSDQNINQPYFFNAIKAHKFDINSINNVAFGDMFSYEKFINNITDFLTYRNANVGVVDIKGALEIKKIEDKDFEEVLDQQEWKKLHQNSSHLLIDGDVSFESLNIQNLAGTNFNEYISNIVFKNVTNIDIQGDITFDKGLIVEKVIETSILNNIALKNILRKSVNQTIASPIHVFGNASIEDDVIVKKSINNVEITYMMKNFTIGEESLIVKDEVVFNNLSHIQNLTIKGLINERDFNKLKNKFVYKHQDINLQENVTFNNMVHIKGNLETHKDINGVILSKFFPKVVWLKKYAEIIGPIRFARPVECYEYLNANEINTKLLFGKDLEQIIMTGVSIDKGLLKGSFHFENLTIHEDLRTKFINTINMDTLVLLKTPQQLDKLDIAEMTVVNDFEVGNNVNGINLIVERNRTLLNNVKQYLPSEIVFLNNVMVEDNLIAKLINKKPISKIVTTNTEQNLTAYYNFKSKTWSNEHFTVKGYINDINITLWKQNAIFFNSKEPLQIQQKFKVMENLNLAEPLHGHGMINDLNIIQLVKDVEERENYLCDIERKIMDDFSNICKDITYLYEKTKHQIYKFKYFEELQTLRLPNNINYIKHFQYNKKNYLLINEKQSCFSKLMEFNGREGLLELRNINTGIINQIEIIKNQEMLVFVSRGFENEDLNYCNMKVLTIIWKLTAEQEDLEIIATTEPQQLLQESKTPNTFYGLKNKVVTEFKISSFKEPILLVEYRKWNINEDNARFIPNGLKTDLALVTNKETIILNTDFESVAEEKIDVDVEATIIGNYTKEANNVIPGRGEGVIALVDVGVHINRKKMLAVASHHNNTQVEHRLDILEIYSNPFTGEVFDKILTNKPTQLTSIEFQNGETLLAFMEHQKLLQIYEYKGIEGFKHRSSIKIQADQMLQIDLGIKNNPKKVLGLVYKNKITFLQAVMAGTRPRNDLNCAN